MHTAIPIEPVKIIDKPFKKFVYLVKKNVFKYAIKKLRVFPHAYT